MGILKDIGFLDDEGNLSNNAKEEFINDVMTETSNLPPSMTLAGVTVDLQSLSDMIGDETAVSGFDPANFGGVEGHKEQFPQYHKLYVDTLFAGLAKMLDLEPEAQLKNSPIPLFDPTQPILIILEAIRPILESIEGFITMVGDVVAFVTSQIDYIMGRITDIIGWLMGIFIPPVNFDIGFLAGLIREMLENFLDDAEEFISEVEAKIIEKAEEIKEATLDPIIEFIQDLFNVLSSLPPEFPFIPFSLDLFGFNFDFDFDIELPWFDLSPFMFESPPGIVKLIIDFATALIIDIPLMIAEIALQIPVMILQGITTLLEFLITSVVDRIIELLKGVWPDISQYTLPAASFLAMFKKVIPMVIVGIVGILIGPGLITFSLAQLLGLI